MAKSPARGADFVAKIVKDPKNPPKTIMLTGFLGASSEPGHTRLYFDPHLSNYVEVPDDAILHTQEAPGEGGLEATHVWIRQDAQLIYGPAGAERPKGTFLEGPIMQAHMPAAAAAGGAGIVAPAPNTANPACVAQPSVAIICQSAAVVCQSLLVQCQTRQPACITAPTLCCTVPIHFCPPRTPFVDCPPTPHQPCLTVPAICQRTPFLPCVTQQWPGCGPLTLPLACGPVTLPAQCPILSAPIACPSFGPCPSIAGCPSLGGCPIGPETPIVQPAADAVAARQAAVAAVAPQVATANCVAVFTLPPHACQSLIPEACNPGCPGGTIIALPTVQVHCRPTLLLCPSVAAVCPSVPVIRCPSVIDVCLTQNPLNCQLQTAVCPRTPFCPQLTPACPIQTPACPIVTAACPFPTAGCPFGIG